MKIHYTTIEGRFFQFWYDNSTRCWWTAEFDADASDGSNANQIGSAEHSGDRDGIMIQIEYLFDINTDDDDLVADYSRGPKHPVLWRARKAGE